MSTVSLKVLEEKILKLLCDENPAYLEGIDPAIQKVDRIGTWNGVNATLKDYFPKTLTLLKAASFERIVRQYLSERQHRARLTRQSPIHFYRWLREKELNIHPALADVVYFETLTLSISCPTKAKAPPAIPINTGIEHKLSTAISLHGTARLAKFNFDVMTLESEPEKWPDATDSPIVRLGACLDGESTLWYALDPQIAVFLSALKLGHSVPEAIEMIKAKKAHIDFNFWRAHLKRFEINGIISGNLSEALPSNPLHKTKL